MNEIADPSLYCGILTTSIQVMMMMVLMIAMLLVMIVMMIDSSSVHWDILTTSIRVPSDIQE